MTTRSESNKRSENNKLQLYLWLLILFLISLVVMAIHLYVSENEIKNDISELKEFANTTRRDSTAVSQKADIINMVYESTGKTFDKYVSTQGNLLAIAGVLITVIVIVIPLILNNIFQTTNEEWYQKRIEDAETKITNKLKKGLDDLKEETKASEEKYNSQKFENKKNKRNIDQYRLIVEGQANEIKRVKDRVLRISSNYSTEIKFMESLEKVEIKDSLEAKIKYLKGEIEKNKEKYPARGFFKLGKLYFEKGEHDKAIKNYEMAIEKSPDYAEAYHSLAQVLLCQAKEQCIKSEKEKMLKDAWKAIEVALGIEDNISMLETRSDVFFKMSLFKDAKKDIERCINLAEESEKEKYGHILQQIIDAIEIKSKEESTEVIKVKEVSFKMKKIAGGSFAMGVSDNDNEAALDERPVHQVLLDDYYVSETVVTQELWEAVVGSSPSPYLEGKNLPMVHVSWNDIRDFLLELNIDTENHRPKGTVFCLPTEAQWEFAALGGNLSNNYKYSGSNDIREVAWYWQNSGDDYLIGKDEDWDSNAVKKNHSCPHPVMTKRCNELGLYDMSGNVWEWCQDGYGIYNSEPQINPKKTDGSDRVARGGSWFNPSSDSRVSNRMKFAPDNRYRNLGFRLALVSNNI